MKYVIALILSLSAAISIARAETFLIQATGAGHEATVRIPVGAIAMLSANFAEPLPDRADPRVESMRLSGAVVIGVAGSAQPILIKADTLILELAADAAQEVGNGRGSPILRSAMSIPGPKEPQVYIGDVVFDVPTSWGLARIKADRVERRSSPG